jgi:hypothetical protein
VQSVDRSNGDGGALVGGQRSPELKFDGLGFWGQASKTRRTDVGPKEEGNAPSGLALGYVALTELGNHGNQAPPQLSVVALIEEEVIGAAPGDRFSLTSGGSRRDPDQAGTKLNRTFRWGLSMLRSTNTTDCHVPRAGRPPNTGSVIEGLTNAGRTWSAP